MDPSQDEPEAGSTRPSEGETGRPPLWMLGVLLVLTLGAFWPALGGELVYDDLDLVGRNPTIRSIDRLSEGLSAAYWDFLDPETASRIGYWRPLTAVALYIGHQIGGGEPWAFHAVSIGLHVLAIWALFLFARRLSGSDFVAFFSALLFSLHPAQVEAVAWISAVNDPLYGLFCLLAMNAWLGWRDRGSPGWPRAASLLLFLALLGKENGAAFVVIALAIDLGRRLRDGGGGSLLDGLKPFQRAYLPVIAIGVAYYLLRVAVFGNLGAGLDRTTTFLDVSMARLLSLRVEILGGFLGVAAWPVELNVFRDIRPVLPSGDPTLLAACAWLGLAAAIAAILAVRRARPALAAFLILPAGLAPMLLRMESVGRFPVSDRFLYVPLAGLAIFLALGARRWLPARPAAVILLGLAGLYAWRSVDRIAIWHDEETLFAESAAATPDSPYVQWGLGRVMLGKYQETRQLEYLRRARTAYDKVVELHDRAKPGPDQDLSIYASREDFLQTNLGLGWCHLFEAEIEPEEYAIAEAIFRSTLEMPAYRDTARAWSGLGVALTGQNRMEEAREAHLRATELDPKNPELWTNLAEHYLRAGDWESAAATFGEVLLWSPDDFQALIGKGGSLIDSGEPIRARELLLRAARVDPASPVPHIRLGNLEANLTNWDEALTHYNAALERDGLNATAYLERGKVWLHKDLPREALKSFDRAVGLRPNDFGANVLFADALGRLGLYEAAYEAFQRAEVLAPSAAEAEQIRRHLDVLREHLPEEGQGAGG